MPRPRPHRSGLSRRGARGGRCADARARPGDARRDPPPAPGRQRLRRRNRARRLHLLRQAGAAGDRARYFRAQGGRAPHHPSLQPVCGAVAHQRGDLARNRARGTVPHRLPDRGGTRQLRHRLHRHALAGARPRRAGGCGRPLCGADRRAAGAGRPGHAGGGGAVGGDGDPRRAHHGQQRRRWPIPRTLATPAPTRRAARDPRGRGLSAASFRRRRR